MILRNAGAAAPVLLVACMARGPVTRVADGETLEGRPIAPEAYAAYLRASVLEARGDARGALGEFERALDEDPGSPEIVTRIARLLCFGSPASPDAFDEAIGGFEDALALDPTYAPAWLGLAECRERHGERATALVAAERAARYDPRNAETTRVVARLLFALGKPDDAWRWLEAFAVLEPESRDIELVMLDEALKRKDAPRETRARLALARLGVSDDRSRETALDDALRAGDLPRARALATELSLRPSALALRALGASPGVALEQAKLVLDADPSDSDAWIAALVAADELGDEITFAQTARLLDPDPLAPSAEALGAFEKLVARRLGRGASEAFAGAQRKP